MVATPEAAARELIDDGLRRAGWQVQDRTAVNLLAGPGVAVREFSLKPGYGEADYLLYAGGKAVGVVEAKPVGTPLKGVEIQSAKYSAGLPDYLPAWRRPLPMLYETTGVRTQFTNLLDPEPRSREVFAFHRPETLRAWAAPARIQPSPPSPLSRARERGSRAAPPSHFSDARERGGRRLATEEREGYDAGEERATLRGRLRGMPAVVEEGLWPAQVRAVRNLEASLAAGRPRALVQMATGSGKTFTAVTSIYRLIKHAEATRVLFLVDRANLGRQTLKEFQQYATPDDGRKFTELYNVQHLQANRIDPVARVCITTIQRLYSMLRGDEELDPTLEEASAFDTLGSLINEPAAVEYNPEIPIGTFDVIFTDECHRSIYNLWRQVLEYFDAFTIGLTATPSKQTFGYFGQNLVMEYNHAQAVADGVNVDFDVYKIRTRITEGGSTVESGYHVDKRDRLTRKVRWEQLDEELQYEAKQLDRDVVSEDQIRTVVRTFRDRLFTEIFPGRWEVPKTLIFAKDDSHADDIVKFVREEFGKGNDFCQKITYKTTGEKPENLLASFRNSYNPRIVVTVDMIATGTDVKPLEVVMFMRAVKSRNFFEQMKGRGVRVINPTDFRNVTPDAMSKDRFVLVDCVGVSELPLVDNPPLDRQPGVALEKLLNAVGFGSTDPDLLSSVASRLARLDRQIGEKERAALATEAGGATPADIAEGIVRALDPDRQIEAARAAFGLPAEAEPSAAQVAAAAEDLLRAAVQPLMANPDLRTLLVETRRRHEQTIDTVSQDEVIEAGYSADARERARTLTASFELFIAEHKDEITALQVLYSRPYGQRLRFREIKELAEAIEAPPRSWTPAGLWRAYEALDKSKVRGSGGRMLTDVVALVRFALRQEEELAPFKARVDERFAAWLVGQEANGRRFSAEQRGWLESIRDHIAASYRIEVEDFEEVPFNQRGGLGKVYQVFGDELNGLLDELNEVLAA